MNAKDVIERFCKLQTMVAEYVSFDYAADCFCKQSGFWGSQNYGGTFDEGYRNDGNALLFIEQAVSEKMARDTHNARLTRAEGDDPEYAPCTCSVSLAEHQEKIGLLTREGDIHYLEVKCKQQEVALAELAKYFTSGNCVPVERAMIKAKDFWRITGLEHKEQHCQDDTTGTLCVTTDEEN